MVYRFMPFPSILITSRFTQLQDFDGTSESEFTACKPISRPNPHPNPAPQDIRVKTGSRFFRNAMKNRKMEKGLVLV